MQNWHFVLLARLGYAARGLVYLLLGGIALYSIFLGTSEEPSSEGALASLLGQPFGRILLLIMGVGLCAYAAWRLAQALANVDDHEDDIKGYATRAGILVSAAVHVALAVFALRLAVGSDVASSGGSKDTIAGWLMQQPFGRYLVGGVGLVVIAAGVAQIVEGIKGGYRKCLRIPHDRERILHPICSYGLIARGLVFLVIGGFFVFAAAVVQPEQAASMPEALEWVRQLPFGAILYGVIALGLFAFGAYNMVQAVYRQISPRDIQDIKRKMATGLPG